jgi:hypothetical protein
MRLAGLVLGAFVVLLVGCSSTQAQDSGTSDDAGTPCDTQLYADEAGALLSVTWTNQTAEAVFIDVTSHEAYDRPFPASVPGVRLFFDECDCNCEALVSGSTDCYCFGGGHQAAAVVRINAGGSYTQERLARDYRDVDVTPECEETKNWHESDPDFAGCFQGFDLAAGTYELMTKLAWPFGDCKNTDDCPCPEGEESCVLEDVWADPAPIPMIAVEFEWTASGANVEVLIE